ncbi:hypothetical protein RGQ29_025188 [Quercus rubra]|uniref:Uncharacterized protein n=1 Tax=Quercus rubra TaxID=3512 RepID=A0AAN7IHN1_QUERU|nr:hypothetical protein RGQ29_025188 [Quercus rubra]
MAMSKVEKEEEETERLVMGTTKVVYYLEPLMSKELLCKFPDKSSAFNFDYTQSLIWSPLVPRAYSAMDLDSDFEDLDFMTPTNRKISFGGVEESHLQHQEELKKLNINLNLNAWTKALKAASKHFKKKKKKDPTAHVKLSNNLRDGNISR